MSDSGGGSLSKCTADSATGHTMATTVAEEKGKKRAGSELSAEAPKLMAAEVSDLDMVTQVSDLNGGKAAQEGHGVADEEVTAAGTKKKKWRVPQDLIDFILSCDVSDYVPKAPDNLDDLPISDEYKAQYRARRKQAVAVMQESRSTQRKMQEWVKAELEKHGYVEVETTAEMLEKHQLEEYIGGQIA